MAEFGETPWRTVSGKVFLKGRGAGTSQGSAEAVPLQPVPPKGDPARQVTAGLAGRLQPVLLEPRSQVSSGLGGGRRCAQTPAISEAHAGGWGGQQTSGTSLVHFRNRCSSRASAREMKAATFQDSPELNFHAARPMLTPCAACSLHAVPH